MKGEFSWKKVLRIMLRFIGCLLLLAVILLLTIPLWLGPVARPTVNGLLPPKTGTEVRLGHLSLNPYTGRLEIGDFVVGNPPGYDVPVAFSCSNIVVDVAMSTVFDQCVHIEEIVVEDLYLSSLKGGTNDVDNLLQIQYNLAGGREKFEENQAKSEREAKAAQERDEARAREELEAERAKLEKMSAEEREAYEKRKQEAADALAAAERRFVIDRLVVKGLSIRYGLLTIPLPSLELHGIGDEGKGVSVSEFFDELYAAIIKAVTSVGDGIKELGGAIGEGAGKAAEAVSEGAGKAVDAVSEGAGKTVDAIKGLFN